MKKFTCYTKGQFGTKLNLWHCIAVDAERAERMFATAFDIPPTLIYVEPA